MKTGILLLGLIPLLVINSAAQWPDNSSFGSQGEQRGFPIRGQIASENIFIGSVTVELAVSGHSIAQSTSLAADGSFEFRSVTPGAYDLRLTSSGGDVIHQERVIISGPNQLLSVNVPRRGSADRSDSATVSIRQLQHKIPPPAHKEYSKGQAAAKKGDYRTAIDHYEGAIGIDPEYADAYAYLGAAQVSLGQLDEGAKQFQKAIDLVPDHTLAIANLSIVLSKLKRYDEAGQAARQALKLDPSLLKMRYILALSLTMKQGHETEALENLERAASEIPKAHLLAADILTHTGRRDDAARQLEQYLRAAPARDTDRERVEEWLAQLRSPRKEGSEVVR
jgi:tetratricopeptide (TPR) repeat protein